MLSPDLSGLSPEPSAVPGPQSRNRRKILCALQYSPAGPNHCRNECLIHIDHAFIFSEIALAVSLVQHAPLLGRQRKRMVQTLKHLVAVLGTIAVPARKAASDNACAAL